MPTISFSADGTSSSIKYNRRTSGQATISCHAYGTFGSGTLTPQYGLDGTNFDDLADATPLTADGHFGFNLDSGFYRFVLAGSTTPTITVDCSQGNVVT